MSDSFYKAFEDRHRGSRTFIKARLRTYLPFVEPLAELHPPGRAVDLGCGRGEWLELLGEHGFQARGVDVDEAMLEECRAHHLEVEREDAVAFLRRLADESVSVVSGFHLAEHLPFEHLRVLVTEALRVLEPAGLLILETPNPENLVVGASSFYLDPTHQRPLPPKLLSFLAEHAGFARTKVVRLNEDAAEAGEEDGASLAAVLTGVSPDYSIVAQKAAPSVSLQRFDALFETPYGVSLEAALARYQEELRRKLGAQGGGAAAWDAAREASERLERAFERERAARENAEATLATERQAHAELLAELAREREARMRLEAELEVERGAKQRLEGRLGWALKERARAKAKLKAVYRSRSWRITSPLRGLARRVASTSGQAPAEKARPAEPQGPPVRSERPDEPAPPSHLTADAGRVYGELVRSIRAKGH